MSYREHRVRTSLGRSAAVAPADDDALRALAQQAWRKNGTAVFFEDQKLTEAERRVIDAAAAKLYGERRTT